jgi:hypothetical protein
MPFLCHLEDFEQVQFDIRPIDENGIYSICWVFDNDTDLSNVSHACRLKHHNSDGSFYHLLCYNMYHKELMMRCFVQGVVTDNDTQLHIPPGEFYPFAWEFWEFGRPLSSGVVYTTFGKANVGSAPWHTPSNLRNEDINIIKLTFINILLINLLIYIVMKYIKAFYTQINTTMTTN